MYLKTATSVMLPPARLHFLEQRSAATPVEDPVLNTQAREGPFSLKPPPFQTCESNQVPSQGKCVGGKSACAGTVLTSVATKSISSMPEGLIGC